ncbi:LysR family transcriptional regulator [Rhodococcus hoagii]|nr:LysR family transcriptional regulator [Prescottella equi]
MSPPPNPIQPSSSDKLTARNGDTGAWRPESNVPGAAHGSGEVNVEFRQAEHFLAVIEHGSLVRASSALHLAQPSLSQSIQTLERDLGAPLFHRVGRGLVPTAVGTALVAPARQLLRDVATAQASVAEFSGLHGGHVDIGTTAGLYESRVPALVGELRRTYRSVTVRSASTARRRPSLRLCATAASSWGSVSSTPRPGITISTPTRSEARNSASRFPGGSRSSSPIRCRSIKFPTCRSSR